MKIELVALKGQVHAKRFRLGVGQKLILGRGEDAEIQILDSGLSRHHCFIENQGDAHVITDLGSTNGTWVNENRVVFQRLTPGDRVRIGAIEFEFRSTPDPLGAEADFIVFIPDLPIREIRGNVRVEETELMVIPRESQSIENYRRVQRDLATVYHIGNLLNAEFDLTSLYDRVLDVILDVIQADRGLLMIANREGRLETVARREAPSPSGGAARGAFSAAVAEECYRDRTSILRADALPDERDGPAPSAAGREVHSVLCAPVEAQERAIGVIYLDTVAQSEAFLKCDLELLLAVGKQAGLAIERLHLSERLRQMLRGAVRALAAAIEAKDPYTEGHSERVTAYALQIGAEMCLDRAQLRMLELAGFLHDVGKIGVPENILTKAGPLTEEEYEVLKTHSRVGSAIIRNIEGAEEIAKIVLHHHERWDGKGFPDGLAQDKPPLLSRILAVADAFDAMSSQRPYRDRIALEKTLRTVREAAGTQFDPTIAELLFRAVSEGRIPAGGAQPGR